MLHSSAHPPPPGPLDCNHENILQLWPTRGRSLVLFYLFKILKTFTKMLHTSLIGCRGKAKKDKKYNISKLKKKKIYVIVLNRLRNISHPQIRKFLILSYFIKNFPTYFSLCKSVILCGCSNVKPLIDAEHTGPNSQLNICENSSFTTLQKGHCRFDVYSPLKLSLCQTFPT